MAVGINSKEHLKDDAPSRERQDFELEYVSCNLCSADNTDLFSSDGSLNLLRCRNCGLYYVSPRLTATHIRRLYNRQYFQALDSSHGDGRIYKGGYRDYLADEQNYIQTFRKRFKWIEKYSPHGRKMLDVGSGAGYFMAVARENGWCVQGVEPASFVADYARSQLSLDVFPGTLLEANYPSGSFDLVALWDVLEHMPDPRRDLAEVHRVLNRSGIVILETQNIGSWLPKILGYRWPHFGHHLHLFHFTPETITKVLHNAGFRVIKITSSSAGKVCSLRFLGDKLRIFNRTSYLFINRLFTAFPSLSKKSLYINLGDEMIVIAQKES